MPHVIDHSLTPRAHHRTSWSLPVAVSIALPVAALLAGCGGTVHPTLSELESLPAASAHYPGSVELARFDGDSVNTMYNKQSAILRSNWCAPATMLAVHSWFARTLADAGWIPVRATDGSAGADAALVAQWSRGDRTFDLYRLTQPYMDRRRADPSDPATRRSCVVGYAIRVI